MRKKLTAVLQILLMGTLGIGFLAPVEQAQAITADDAKKKFEGMNFGLGVGVVGVPSQQRLARSAQVVNGVVRVDDDTNVTASVILESHYFFTQKADFLGVVDKNLWGHGPFVAIKTGGDNQFIDAIGLGWMLGFRYTDTATSSWNIGAGLSLSPSVRVLGDGVTRDQALPPGETQIRYKTTSLVGFMVLASFSWTSF